MKTTEFTQHLDDVRIAEEIHRAEQATSGEIRVFISRQPSEDPLAEAQREFHRLNMHQTPQRNAVLLYFAPLTQRFALYADEGIYQCGGEDFWKATTQEMEGLLRAGTFHEAVVIGIRRTGVELARHFPKYPNDRNDLPNAVVRD